MLEGEIGRIVDILKEKGGEDIVVLDIREANPAIGDYFVIVTGYTTDHLLDMAEELRTRLGGRVEGNEQSSWVILDLGDIVVHLFLPRARTFYSLEDIYSDADMIYTEREEVM